MCHLCFTYKLMKGQGVLPSRLEARFLEEISVLAKQGYDPAHLDALMDDVLGTGLAPRNTAAEEAWEQRRCSSKES